MRLLLPGEEAKLPAVKIRREMDSGDEILCRFGGQLQDAQICLVDEERPVI
jgi:hypothetical protein